MSGKVISSMILFSAFFLAHILTRHIK